MLESDDRCNEPPFDYIREHWQKELPELDSKFVPLVLVAMNAYTRHRDVDPETAEKALRAIAEAVGQAFADYYVSLDAFNREE